MRLVVVGGHSRNIGKTALAVDIIRLFPEARWTAVKITQYGHGVCSVHGEPCDCAPQAHGMAWSEETSRENRTDTSRFLVAGAARAFWLRVEQGRMFEAMPALREILAGAENAILESNTLLRFVRPDLYVVVLDPGQTDFKESARQMVDRADLLVLRAPLREGAWPGVSPQLLEGPPRLDYPLTGPAPAGLAKFFRERLFCHSAPR